jgi:predicted PurR-regulated permease PerM
VSAYGRPPVSFGERASLVGWARFAAVALGALIFYLLRYVLLPFAIAAAFAYLAAPVVRTLRSRCRLPHAMAALIVYVAYLGCVFGLLLLGRATVVPQVQGMLTTAPANLHRLFVDLFHGETLRVFGDTFRADRVSHDIVQWIGGLLYNPAALIGIGQGTFALIMGFFMTLALLGYFLFAGPSLQRGTLWLVPPAFRGQASTLASDVSPVVYDYVRGMLVVVTYAATVTWAVMRFVVHLPHAALLGIAIGALEMVPLMGPILGMILIGLVAAERATPATIVAFAAFLTGLRLSIDQLVGPLVLGRAVRLPPPVIIFAFLAGAVLYGPVGVLLAIPVAAAVKIVLRDLYGDTVDAMRPRRPKQQRAAQ